MPSRIPLIARLAGASTAVVVAASAHGQFKIDIDSTHDGTAISTENGWTSLDATNANGGSVTVGGITFQPFSADGSRNRTAPNALTGDFVFDDGSGQAVGLVFGGAGDLQAGDWQVKLWIWDASAPVGACIVGYRTNNAETIVSNSVTPDPVSPAITFTFASDGVSAYDVFVRENNNENRSRLNAVELTQPDGPSEITLAGTQVSKSAPVGALVGTLGSVDPTPGDTFTYALVTGAGSGDNFRFAIMGDRLEVDSDLTGLSGGDFLSVRIRSTDAGGASLEESFVIAVVNDSDNDLLDDDWELMFFPDLATASGNGNNDADGLTNVQEQAAGTNPLLADTDGDTLNDDIEDNSGIFNGPGDPGSDPTLIDTDNDGINDNDEISSANGFVTDPTRQDTDGDGFPDPLEIAEGTDPTNAGDFPDTLLPLRINEFLANNVNGIEDGFGNAEDWIEIHNPNNQVVNLDGYFLTDDSAVLTKWNFPDVTIPASGYLVVFASGRDLVDDGAGNVHAGFSLRADGEYLAIVRPDGTTIDQEFAPAFPEQFPDVSYGAHPTNGTERYFDARTPGSANNTGFDDVVRDTTFSIDRGFYDTAFDVAVTSETAGATIRYTTDGTKPSETHGTIYSSPISVTTTTTLRAIAFKPGALSTNVDTHTYIFIDDVAQQSNSQPGYPATWGSISQGTVPADYEMDPRVVNNTLPGYGIRDALLDIPTMSVVMAPGDFLGTATSIYDHSTSRGSTFEKECSLELIHPDGTRGFQENCEIEMHGNSSRNPFRMQKHSFRVTFRAHLGAAKLRYPLFPQTDVDTFNKLVLRACFTDSWGLASWGAGRYRPNDSQYIRDVWMKESLRAMGQPSSSGNFVHLYVNGMYWGVHNPTERLEDDFFAEHFGGAREDWEINEDFRSADTRYDQMNAINGATSAGYTQIQDFLDVENFADYMLLHFYADSEDWPSHNGYAAANAVSGDGKFRFFVWDQEIALDKFSWNRYDSTAGPGSIFQELRQNAEFRMLFADRAHKHLFNDGALSETNSKARYLGIANMIDKAIVAESARWGDVQDSTPYGNTPGSSTDPDHDNYPPLINNPIYFTREQHWVVERDNILNHYIPTLHDPNDSRAFVNELRAENLYPSLDAPEFFQHGGFVTNGFELNIDAPDTVWYTTNGEDPRLVGGGINPNAQSYEPATSTISETLVGDSAASPSTLFSLVPSDGSLGLTWTEAIFNEVGWETSAPSDLGVGHERNEPGDYGPAIDRNTRAAMLDGHPAIYLRYEFNITGAPNHDDLRLRMKYDDGFVAYLNGTQIDADNEPASPAWNSTTVTGGTNESNVTSFDRTTSVDPNLLRTDLNVLAIHGLNASSGSSDFLIEPELSGVRTVSNNPTPIVIDGSQQIRARSLGGGEWSAITEAFFFTEDLVISEFMYRPATNGDAEYVEILNIGAQAVDLSSVAFTDGIAFQFAGSSVTSIAPGARVLVVRDLADFRSVYGNALDGIIAGEYDGGLSNDGETVRLEGGGTVIQQFTYNDQAPWPESADGDGRSVVLIDPMSGPDHAIASNWRHSAVDGGNPGFDDHVPFTGNTEGEFFAYVFGEDAGVGIARPGTGSSRYTVVRNIASDDAVIGIEISNDLGTWTDLGTGLPVIDRHAFGTREMLTYEISDTFGTGEGQMFVRGYAVLAP